MHHRERFIRRSASLASAFLRLLFAACAGGEPTGPNEPPPPRSLVFDIAADSAVAPGRSVTFAITLTPGTRYRVVLTAQSGLAKDTLVATVRDSTGSVLATLSSVGDQGTVLEGPFMFGPVATSRRVTIEVRGRNATSAGAFRIVVRPPGGGPEVAPELLTVGNTVEGESIDGNRDVDQYRFTASAGDEFVLMFAFSASVPDHRVRLRVELGDNRPVDGTLRIEESPLEQNATAFRVDESGNYSLRVSDDAAFGAGFIAPYRLRLYRIDRRPESNAVAFAIGDTIHEAIDYKGDFDEFTFTATAGQELVFAAATPDPFGELQFHVLHEDTLRVIDVELTAPVLTLDEAGSGRWVVPATATYRLRVWAVMFPSNAASTGDYRFEVYPIDRAPEHISPIIPFPGLVTSERIDRRGDIDEFTFEADSGALYAQVSHSTWGPLGGNVTIRTIASNGTSINVDVAESSGASSDSTISYGPITIPSRGTHRVQVSSEVGRDIAYAVSTFLVDPAPESLPGLLPFGSWVSGESLLHANDIDDFTIDAVEGQTLTLRIEKQAGAQGDFMIMGDIGRAVLAQTDGTRVRDIIVPATGSYRLRVARGLVASTSSYGPYRVRLDIIDRAPETVPPALSIGASVTSEAIDPFGDIDEFLLPADTSDHLRITLDPVSGQTNGLIGITITDAATGTVLWGVGISSPTDWTPPYSGTFRFTVSGGGLLGGTGPYHLSVVRSP